MKAAPFTRHMFAALFNRVDGSSLAAFRIMFGALMVWEVKRYFAYGWIERYWIEPSFHFSYDFFEWIQPWPGDGMYYHFAALGVLAFLIGIGLAYRAAAALFCLGFTYVFLLDETTYLNHFYLIALMSFLLVFVPANRVAALDARLGGRGQDPTVPVWALALLAGQIGVVYFFGGVAKLNADWLAGQPLSDWLTSRADFPLIGRFFTEPLVGLGFSYGALLLDLLALPLLLWRRTRLAAFVLLTLFHLMNARLFSIGVFPWFGIAATTLFFEPNWPRRLVRHMWVEPSRRGAKAWLGTVFGIAIAAAFNGRFELMPLAIGGIAGGLITWKAMAPQQATERTAAGASASWTSLLPAHRVVLALFGCWFVVQSIIPLRHFFIPGNVSWTEEGHRFAWHMKLRDKDGDTRFVVVDRETGWSEEIDPRDYLTDRQYRKMATRPHMIRRFAHHLAGEYQARGRTVEVRALATAALNGRSPQPLIDPDTDLAAQTPDIGPASWIIPMGTTSRD